MKNLYAYVFIILLNSCLTLRPVSGTIFDKQSGKPIIGAKVYNKARTYETALSDSTGHFYFLSPRSYFAIRPLKIGVEKELYKPLQLKYRKFKPKEIRIESINK